MWSTAKWRTAIPAEFGQQESAREADLEGLVHAASAARALAAVAVVGGAVSLAVLPALVGFGLISGSVVAGMAAVAAIAGAVKLAAMGWGLAGRWVGRPGLWSGAASIE